MEVEDSESLTPESLTDLLLSIPSPRPLLRPQFWRMHPGSFLSAFHTQFLSSSGSADCVFRSSETGGRGGELWLGNKTAAEGVVRLKEKGITHLLNCTGAGRETQAGAEGI